MNVDNLTVPQQIEQGRAALASGDRVSAKFFLGAAASRLGIGDRQWRREQDADALSKAIADVEG